MYKEVKNGREDNSKIINRWISDKGRSRFKKVEFWSIIWKWIYRKGILGIFRE